MFLSLVKICLRIVSLRSLQKEPDKILLVAEFGKTGGTRTYLFYLLEFLYKQKLDVTLLVNGSEKDEEVALVLKNYNFKTLEINFDFWCIDLDNKPIGFTKKQMLQYQIKELNFWYSLQKQHRFSSLIFSVGYPEQYLYTFLLPVSIIYILHTTPLKHADHFKKKFLRYFLGPKKQIITVSEYARQLILHYWLNGRPSCFVHFVYNYYSHNPKQQVTKKQSNTNKKTVLTIGSLEAYKSPLIFIETAKTILSKENNKEVRFIWAGDGSMMETCRNLTLNHPEISFIGNTKDIDELYDDATIYYQPSVLESHGISVLGAMFHHLPCVVSNNGGLKESITEGTGFVVPVEDAEASVEKITTLLNDEVLCNRLGKKAFEQYNLKFTEAQWEKAMIKRLENYV